MDKLSGLLDVGGAYLFVLSIFALLLGLVVIFLLALLIAVVHGKLTGKLSLEWGGKSRRVFKWSFLLLFWGLPVLGLWAWVRSLMYL